MVDSKRLVDRLMEAEDTASHINEEIDAAVEINFGPYYELLDDWWYDWHSDFYCFVKKDAKSVIPQAVLNVFARIVGAKAAHIVPPKVRSRYADTRSFRSRNSTSEGSGGEKEKEAGA